MCGIAGFCGEGTPEDLWAMTALLAHRGPDGENYHIDPDRPVFLGHRRLAVVDLVTGAQPMWSQRRDVGIVFNGEIYNHVELRRELESQGQVFLTEHSDTEVILLGYRQWGRDICRRLNGMFAFCILDRTRNCLFLARDRCGEKPLYYAPLSGGLAFASEIPALLRHPALSGEIDPVGLQKYFAYGYVPAPLSLYKGCCKLPAASWLECDIATGALHQGRYWNFAISPDPSLEDADENALAEELEQLLRNAVARRLVADVPVGIFLSGGIDSSSIVGNACRIISPDRVKTFTVGFTEPSYDESANARAVAAHFGSTHAERFLSMEDMGDAMPAILDRLGEPIVDPSILPTYFLCKFARESVTVALSGDGGDELFAGYAPFKALAPARLYDRVVPRHLHALLRRLVEVLPKSDGYFSLDFKLRRTLQGLGHPESRRNPVWMAPLDPDLFASVFDAPLPVDELYGEAIQAWDNADGDPINASLDFYTRFYLPENILTKTDRASMAVSLETRAVFLDNHILDFCARLPSRHKFAGNQGKIILRKALARLLPKDVLSRPKKGFGIPLPAWIRRQMPTAPDTVPTGMSLAGAQSLWRKHSQREEDHRLFLFGLYALNQALGASRR